MTDKKNGEVPNAECSRANAINAINAAATGLSKSLLGPGDVAVSHATAQIATAAALVYLGDCVREGRTKVTV